MKFACGGPFCGGCFKRRILCFNPLICWSPCPIVLPQQTSLGVARFDGVFSLHPLSSHLTYAKWYFSRLADTISFVLCEVLGEGLKSYSSSPLPRQLPTSCAEVNSSRVCIKGCNLQFAPSFLSEPINLKNGVFRIDRFTTRDLVWYYMSSLFSTQINIYGITGV